MHAFLIIAHNQFNMLEKLICALDDERNDIFIHIDAKVRDFDFDHFLSLAKHSRVIFTDERVNVTWGDYSQVKTEIVLLKKAIACENADKPYQYFHLISGVDLPIKTNDYIHHFFDEHNGKEFIHFTDNRVTQLSVNRLQYYHFFRRRRNTIFKILSQLLLRIQKALHINRLKKRNLLVQKGCNWFSVTGQFAHYLFDHLEEYAGVFKHTYCADETFVQTVLVNSPFKDNLYMPDCSDNHEACMRLIDWERGNPYVWRSEDYDAIMHSPCIFARKFDMNIDSEIVEKIIQALKLENI